MLLLFISPSFYPAIYYGGPIYSTYALASELKKQAINIKVVTTNANGNKKLDIKTNVYHLLENDLPVKYYNSLDSRGTSLSMFFYLWKDFKHADVIYLISTFSPTTPITLLYNIFYGKKIIISPRGQLGKWCLSQGNRLKKLWLKVFISPFIKKLVWHLTSEEEQRDIKAVYPQANSFVVPNGIDIKRTEKGEQKKDKLFYKKYSVSVQQNSRIIISMGRIHQKKGYDILVEAFTKVNDQLQRTDDFTQKKDIFLFIAGEDFGEKSKLLKLISSMGLESNIQLIGHIEGEEKINFLKNADVFVLPSHDENFGMVYAEALAEGTTIIASTNTPWQEVEKHNCGKWVENTPGKFADAIINILNSNPDEMGANGRKYVNENFSWEKITRLFADKINQSTIKHNSLFHS